MFALTAAGPACIWLHLTVRSRLFLSPSKRIPTFCSRKLAGLKPGAYKLQWQVLASDGHISRGEVAFTVI